MNGLMTRKEYHHWLLALRGRLPCQPCRRNVKPVTFYSRVHNRRSDRQHGSGIAIYIDLVYVADTLIRKESEQPQPPRDPRPSHLGHDRSSKHIRACIRGKSTHSTETIPSRRRIPNRGAATHTEHQHPHIQSASTYSNVIRVQTQNSSY